MIKPQIVKGFTLTELLIALAILGIIAAFAIPKILQAQQNAQFLAVGREDEAMFAAAYQAYILKNGYSLNTSFGSLLPYFNYLKKDTASLVDDRWWGGSIDCSNTASYQCYTMSNGSTVWTWSVNGESFSGTDSLASISLYVDPDSKYSGSATGSGKSVRLFLYYNGRLTTYVNMMSGTYNNFGTVGACAGCDPDWWQ